MTGMSLEAARELTERYQAWGTNPDYAASLVMGIAVGLGDDELSTEGLTSTNRREVLENIKSALSALPATET